MLLRVTGFCKSVSRHFACLASLGPLVQNKLFSGLACGDWNGCLGILYSVLLSTLSQKNLTTELQSYLLGLSPKQSELERGAGHKLKSLLGLFLHLSKICSAHHGANCDNSSADARILLFWLATLSNLASLMSQCLAGPSVRLAGLGRLSLTD